MKNMRSFISRLINEENGGEVIEYALIIGLIVVVAIATIGVFGTRVVARWTSVRSSV